MGLQWELLYGDDLCLSAEKMMIRWMCCITLEDRREAEDVVQRLFIRNVIGRLQGGRFSWFRLLEEKHEGDWVSAYRDMKCAGERGR